MKVVLALNMINTIFGFKKNQTQKFQTDGKRVPITEVSIPSNSVLMVKNADKHAYNAVQLGLGVKKNAKKSELGQIRGANLKNAPRFLREVRVKDNQALNVGDVVNVSDVISAGDIVDVIGTSKGKGFAGGVKRHHFKGGPRTHGQSDRERAPGSIGQTTTPGRVYKGKRMAGRMGHVRVTVKNLKVMDVSTDTVLIKGLVPGVLNSLIEIRKVGQDKKFNPLIEPLKTPDAPKEQPQETKNETEEVETKAEVSKVSNVSKVSKGETESIKEGSVEDKEEIKEEKNA